jgi:hypothetical protein
MDNVMHRKTAIKMSEAAPLPSAMYTGHFEHIGSEDDMLSKRIEDIPVVVKHSPE